MLHVTLGEWGSLAMVVGGTSRRDLNDQTDKTLPSNYYLHFSRQIFGDIDKNMYFCARIIA